MGDIKNIIGCTKELRVIERKEGKKHRNIERVERKRKRKKKKRKNSSGFTMVYT